jgi:hypothetical protein
MGLDISSFAGLSPAPDAELDEDGFPLDEDKFLYLDPAGHRDQYRLTNR